MRKFTIASLLLLFAALPAFSRGVLYGWAERGGYTALTSLSGGTMSAQRSCPAATITVKLAGTATSATIYSTAVGAAKSNPFTATTTGLWHFYADDGDYDVQVSCGVIFSYTLSSLPVGSGTGGTISIPSSVCDGVLDATATIQDAIDVTGGHTIQLPASPAICKTTDQLLIAQHGITFEGSGMLASRILYMPTVDNEAAIKVKLATATIISDVTVRNLFIYTTNTTNLKIGVWLVDVSRSRVESVQIGTDGAWTGGASVSPFTGAGSIGIKIQGREHTRLKRVYPSADIPIYIGNNPGTTGGPLDLDHFTFDEVDTHANGDNPAIYFEEGVTITNTTFQNSAFVFGTYGVYWSDVAGGASGSYDLIFRQIRAEQMTGSGGWVFYLSVASGIQGVRFQDISAGSSVQDVNGVFLRGSNTFAVFDGYQYYSDLVCLDADSTVQDIDWRSSTCFDVTSTVNLGTLVKVREEGILVPLPRTTRLLTPNSVTNSGARLRIQGVNDVRGTGPLANAATVAVPFGSGGIVTGFITISFSGATLDGAITCSVNARGIRTLATTDAALAGCTGNVAGDFTLHWITAASMVIRNNTGETVTYNYQLNWN